MYCTTMIGTIADGVTADQIRDELQAWEKRGAPPGYLSSHVLADSSEQDEWYQKHYAPLLAGEPKWIDGTWIS